MKIMTYVDKPYSIQRETRWEKGAMVMGYRINGGEFQATSRMMFDAADEPRMRLAYALATKEERK